MKRVILQLWEESIRGYGKRVDGCSIHFSPKDRENFLEVIYEDRDVDNIPDEYIRISGEPIIVSIAESLYVELIERGGNLKLTEEEMNNLFMFDEISLKM